MKMNFWDHKILAFRACDCLTEVTVNRGLSIQQTFDNETTFGPEERVLILEWSHFKMDFGSNPRKTFSENVVLINGWS